MIVNRKPRVRTGKLWTTPIEEMTKVVKSSRSLAEVLKHFGYGTTGGSHSQLKLRLKQDAIDFSHIKLGAQCNVGRKFNFSLSKEEALQTIFKRNSSHGTKMARRYLLLYHLKPYTCATCGNAGQWQSKALTLELDHINGCCNDHRLVNLRFLCPNCHSQTETFGAKNRMG